MGGRPIVGDGARSDDPALDALLRRAQELHPVEIDLSLGRLEALLAKLGNPHMSLPPTFHIAGTNGKGSVAAFLRGCLEAAGHDVHVYTSPHLVRFNERIRLAGSLIDDAQLVQLLEEVMAANGDGEITFFELTTATAFLAFSRRKADALVLETGLGGRYDATNVVPSPAACGLAHISRDHERFLGSDVVGIAGEKAGIAKPGVPLVTMRYPDAMGARIAEVAAERGASVLAKGEAWDAAIYRGELHYKDEAGRLSLLLPRLPGAHQAENATLAIAMLRHQAALTVPEAAIRAGIGWADWPARLQRLEEGALVDLLPDGAELWLDGGHNPGAGEALGAFLEANAAARQVVIICGMIAGKSPAGYLEHISRHAAQFIAVAVPGHATHPVENLAMTARNLGLDATTASDLNAALAEVDLAPTPTMVVICGSLYLAGEALKANGTLPD